MPRWIDAKLIKTEERSETTRSFFLELQGLESFDFKAGQFITLDLPIGEKRLDRWRSYSIANEPNSTNLIELVIVRVPFGKATGFLWEISQIGDIFKLKGPGGVFCLPEKIETELVFICTGTGVAPFRSMIKDIHQHSKEAPMIDLIFGTRNKDGILYLDEFNQLQADMENFDFSVALSREEYDGYQGYVHNIYLEKYKNVIDNRTFYLCGWQNMVDEAKENLLGLGYKKDQIIEELYG